MDPVLHDILRDGIQKYLGGEEQTRYVVNDPEDCGYGRLQENQTAIGCDNLIRGKYSKHWRRIQRNYEQKQTEAATINTQTQAPSTNIKKK